MIGMPLFRALVVHRTFESKAPIGVPEEGPFLFFEKPLIIGSPNTCSAHTAWDITNFLT